MEYPNHPIIYIYMYIPILCLVFRIRSDQVAQQDAERQKFIVEKADVQIIWMRNVVITLGEWMVYL